MPLQKALEGSLEYLESGRPTQHRQEMERITIPPHAQAGEGFMSKIIGANNCMCGSANLRKHWYRCADGMRYRIGCESCCSVPGPWLASVDSAILDWNEYNPKKDQAGNAPTLSVSLAEEIAYEIEGFRDREQITQIIQRRVEPLERALEQAADDLHKTASACALHPHLKEFARKVEEKSEAAHQALARIKEGSVCKD